MTEQSNKEKNKKQLVKYAAYLGMGVIFLAAMWLIFSPSSKEKEEKAKSVGFNADIPDPKKQEIVSSKQAAYEQEHVQNLQRERMKTLDNFSEMIGETGKKEDDLSLITDDKKSSGQTKGYSSKKTTTQPSVDAYKDMNRTLGTFYEKPKETDEVKRLIEELESMKQSMSAQNRDPMGDQLELMEKSYQMASKYFPGQTPGSEEKASTVQPAKKNGKSEVSPVNGVSKQVVSALSQPMSDVEFIEALGKERNLGFYSVGDTKGNESKNTISACIHDDQTISDGLEAQRNLRIRLLEPISVGGKVIPVNSIVTGQARIGERLEVTISSIEYEGNIFQTEIIIYDVDGQKGITIPPSLEVNAAKEIAANAGSSAGTSVMITQSAGQQMAADLSRGLVQGTSQYIAKKMRVMKVHLKAGHRVFLLPKDNL